MLKFNKAFFNRLLFIAVISIIATILYYGFCYVVHFVTAIGNSPQIEEQAENNLRKLSSDRLIFMLKFRHLDPFYDPYHILKILSERQEKEAVPEILTLLKSGKSYYRQEAMYALSKIKDPRAIEPLMRIVRQNEGGRDYLLALETLSKMHYEPIYPIIIKMENNNFHVSWAVDMLENYSEKPESLLSLERIANENPETYIRDKARMAIERIKSLQKK